MNTKQLILISIIIYSVLGAIKPLSTCFCDISTSCDPYCCCDQQCSSNLIANWNNYTLCTNDGFAIPLCSSYYNEPMHTHDLYQGLRLIYTIIKRLFCISKVNFVDMPSNFISTTTNSQISDSLVTVSAVSSSNLNLANSNLYINLPIKSSSGVCGQQALKDMNLVLDGSCKVLLSSTSALSANTYLSLSAFTAANNIILNSLTVYSLSTPSSTGAASLTSSSTSCSGTTCTVIKQIKLNFIKNGGSTTIDYTTSYIVIGTTIINSSTYVYIKYSYQFLSQSLNFPYTSNIGYSNGSLLLLLKSKTNSTATTYYKIFNPVNLAFIDIDGTCRTSTSDSDHSNIISFKFGINSVYSCRGTASLAAANLMQAFDFVGSLGISTTNLADYVQIDYTSNPGTNVNLQLIFYYVAIGTSLNPQYQITKAVLNSLTSSGNGQFSLFVQYVSTSTSIILNLPSPPIIDAYLPNDFLYPFYVA